MKADFWHQVWKDQRLGFHRSAVNHTLIEHAPTLGLARGQRVLVPLCGKSLDMAWLRAQGATVTGVELSTVACEAFFQEQGLHPTKTARGAFTRWSAEGIEILQGDVLSLQGEPWDAFYDRAASVALHPTQRADYASVLAQHIRPGGTGLLLTMVYEEGARTGPPFSLPPDTVRAMFGPWFELTLLSSDGHIAVSEGSPPVQEHVWRLVRHT